MAHHEKLSRYADVPRAMSIRDFCSAYGISRAHTYNLIQRGELVAVKMGSRTLIPVSEAEAWFAALPKLAGDRNA